MSEPSALDVQEGMHQGLKAHFAKIIIPLEPKRCEKESKGSPCKIIKWEGKLSPYIFRQQSNLRINLVCFLFSLEMWNFKVSLSSLQYINSNWKFGCLKIKEEMKFKTCFRTNTTGTYHCKWLLKHFLSNPRDLFFVPTEKRGGEITSKLTLTTWQRIFVGSLNKGILWFSSWFVDASNYSRQNSDREEHIITKHPAFSLQVNETKFQNQKQMDDELPIGLRGEYINVQK